MISHRHTNTLYIFLGSAYKTSVHSRDYCLSQSINALNKSHFECSIYTMQTLPSILFLQPCQRLGNLFIGDLHPIAIFLLKNDGSALLLNIIDTMYVTHSKGISEMRRLYFYVIVITAKGFFASFSISTTTRIEECRDPFSYCL